MGRAVTSTLFRRGSFSCFLRLFTSEKELLDVQPPSVSPAKKKNAVPTAAG
jgi:hypothetical protein